MKKHDFQPALKSAFTATGKLRGSVADLAKQLQTMPYLRLSKNPINPTFSILGPDGRSNSELQIMGNKLLFNYSFGRRSLKEYTRNLVSFLSILAYVSDIYEPDMSSLYPYIIEVLAEHVTETIQAYSKIENTELLTKRLKVLSEMNCSLSLKLVDLQSELSQISSSNSTLSRFAKDVVINISEKLGSDSKSIEAISRSLGTTTETYSAVSSTLSAGKIK